jgi:hypothetical protein
VLTQRADIDESPETARRPWIVSRYHPVWSGLWDDEDLEGLPFEVKGFFIFLFTNARMTPSGIYRATDTQLAVDTHLPKKRVHRYLMALVERHRIVRDGTWVFVRGYLARQGKNPQFLRSVEKDVRQCTSRPILEAFNQRYPLLFRWTADPLARVSHPIGDPPMSSNSSSSSIKDSSSLQGRNRLKGSLEPPVGSESKPGGPEALRDILSRVGFQPESTRGLPPAHE